MSKSKYHYYVLVFTSTGPVYVTRNDYAGRFSEWDREQPPREMSKDTAQDIYLGLMWNGYSCVVVQSQIELDHQPYNYKNYEFIPKRKEDVAE